MNKKKNAPPGAGTPNRAMENGSVYKTAQLSTSDSIIPAAERQTFRVADLLLIGEENAIPMRHLQAVTELSSREIRVMIQQEQLEGAAICANNLSGYYIAADDEERARFVRSMRHRAGEILKSADAIGQGGD